MNTETGNSRRSAGWALIAATVAAAAAAQWYVGGPGPAAVAAAGVVLLAVLLLGVMKLLTRKRPPSAEATGVLVVALLLAISQGMHQAAAVRDHQDGREVLAMLATETAALDKQMEALGAEMEAVPLDQVLGAKALASAAGRVEARKHLDTFDALLQRRRDARTAAFKRMEQIAAQHGSDALARGMAEGWATGQALFDAVDATQAKVGALARETVEWAEALPPADIGEEGGLLALRTEAQRDEYSARWNRLQQLAAEEARATAALAEKRAGSQAEFEAVRKK